MNQLIFNRNENPYGPSPAVLGIIHKFPKSHIYSYIDGYYNSILIPKISKLYRIPESQIILSYGIEDFLRMVFDGLTRKDSILTHKYHYAYYRKYAEFKGLKLHGFQMNENKDGFVFDVENCIKRCQIIKPKVILLTSPNNPTGNSLSLADLKRILESASREVVVIVDEAYYGFDNEYNEQGFLSFLRKYPNLVLLRSFSKLYALAGLRIAFALCGKDVKQLLLHQNRYLGISRILEETAIAVFDSKNYYSTIAERIITDREWFIAKTKTLKKFQPFKSKANFVLLKVSPEVVQRLKSVLRGEKILLAKFVEDDMLRVTIGRTKEIRHLFYLIARL